MQNVITYWNRGAERFYGWTAADVVGKVTTHQSLMTILLAPVDEIDAELLRTSRWEGELVRTKADGTKAVVASKWSLQRDEQQRPQAVLEVNKDITCGSVARTKSDDLARNLPSGLPTSNARTGNWKRLPTLYLTTCARPFAMWLGTRSRSKHRHLLCSMTRAVGTSRL
jgi:PAS domain S-box-containing protein